jgi:UDP-GlcNAc:undecaprenyl-phosphate/decaprenyl-phosphate GlcNAc-1-phosphate transferase
MSAPLIAVVACAVTLVATPAVIVLARRTGVVDRPGALKPQERAVPYLGGVAVFAGTLVGVFAGRPSVVFPLAGALGLGVADDRFDLPPLVRLLGQLAVGGLVAATCPLHLPGALATLLLLVATVLVVNGVNLMDGLDMLAAGVAAVGAGAFAAILHGAGRALGIALGAALVGFLAYNRPPARVYLGDGGSYLLGTGLVVLLAEAWAPGVALTVGVAALALVALPVGEVCFAVVRRVRGRLSLLAGDRGHPYDRLVARGWPRPAASLAYIAIEALLGVGAIVAVHLRATAAAIALDLAAAVLLIAAAGLAGALTPDEAARA